jgi:D-alanyl-lipoteichoic acid acyltransferase DltB (MBOAT superfamily)
MLGFDLMLNFDQPYFSRNPVEFWRRWHISLSQWFQDYLYFPLAMHYMRRGGWASRYRAHIISMGLIGLWHGANWTFVAFGLYWGLVIALYLYATERLAEAAPARGGHWVPAPVRHSLACMLMFVIVCGGWILFRAASLPDAWSIVTRMFSATGESTVLRPDVAATPLLWALVIGLWLVEWGSRNWPGLAASVAGSGTRRLILRHAMIVGILFSFVVAQKGTSRPFIYFQF